MSGHVMAPLFIPEQNIWSKGSLSEVDVVLILAVAVLVVVISAGGRKVPHVWAKAAVAFKRYVALEQGPSDIIPICPSRHLACAKWQL